MSAEALAGCQSSAARSALPPSRAESAALAPRPSLPPQPSAHSSVRPLLCRRARNIYEYRQAFVAGSRKARHKEIGKFLNIAEKYDCSSYEINRILSYYKKDNIIIEILKKISSIRNKYIVYYSKKSKYWNENLKNIKNKIKGYNNKNVDIAKIELAFMKILKKYKYDWDGLWSVIEISSSGKVKNIDLFDLDDMNEITDMI